MQNTVIEAIIATRLLGRSTLKPVSMKRVVSKSKARVKANKPKKWKFKKSILAKADASFSEKIRKRDKYCLFPGCFRIDQLTCSHYFGRTTWETRFDEENCITLCRTHHYWDKDIGWEFQKQRVGEKGCDWDGRYTIFMRERLGNVAFLALSERAQADTKRSDAIKKYLCLS